MGTVAGPVYYSELFAVGGEASSADDSMAGRYLFLLAFQIADVEVEVACLVDNVRVLIFGWAGVDELAVPVLEGQPLEFRVLFEIEEGDSVYSLVVRVARNVYSTVVAGPATDDAGGTIVYRGEHCLASCLHIVDADASVLVVSCSGKSEFFPVRARLESLAITSVAADDLLDCPGCEVMLEDRVGSGYVSLLCVE